MRTQMFNKILTQHLFHRLASLGLILLIVILGGCGYSFQGSRSTLPPGINRIYIPQVENISAEAGFGPILTDALRDQFERFGAVTVVDSRAEADAFLDTSVLKVKRTTRTTTGTTDRALQYDTSVTVDVELKRMNGSSIWRNPSLTVSKSFGGTTSSVLGTSADFSEGNLSAADLAGLSSQEVLRSQQATSLRTVASEVARKVYAAAVTGDF